MNVIEKAKELLDITRQAPRMFATSREAMMSRVSTILEMANINFAIQDFYKLHLGTNGCAYATWSEDVTDEWALIVIDDALKILGK
jgi:hypothetical protein